MNAGIGRIVIAGSGIAGLAAAIAFARRGSAVRLFERASDIADIGAGLQLSPNATRVLGEFGVLQRLSAVAVRPERISIRKATSMRELTSVPLGAEAAKRWGSPYLTIHRADLQSALLAEARRLPGIEMISGAAIQDAAFHADGVTLSIDHDGAIREEHARLVIGADGVWSSLRALAFPGTASRDTGYIAWRAVIRPDSAASVIVGRGEVTAILHAGFHLVVYPLRGGDTVNLVVVTRGRSDIGWNNASSGGLLEAEFADTPDALRNLVAQSKPWTTWPIHEAPALPLWTHRAGLALIGDAAHAMSPHAAQGAAMAIEDAAILAALAERSGGDIATLLADYERIRRPRIRRVAARGRFNRFVWHASGPVALARDIVMAARPVSGNMRDLDWLYGWSIDGELGRPG